MSPWEGGMCGEAPPRRNMDANSRPGQAWKMLLCTTGRRPRLMTLLRRPLRSPMTVAQMPHQRSRPPASAGVPRVAT